MNEGIHTLIFAPAAGGGHRFGIATPRRRAPRVALAVRCPLRSSGTRPAPRHTPFDLDLCDEVESASRMAGAGGVVDLLVRVLTDPRITDDAQIDPYLERLKSACRQTRRYRDAIAVFERIAVLNRRRGPEMAAEIALAHAHLGSPAEAVVRLRSAVATYRALPPSRRDAAFCLVAETAATVLREPALAREVAALAQAAVTPVVAPVTAAAPRRVPALV